jgi:hypothetical protein
MEKLAKARALEARPSMNFLQPKKLLSGFWKASYAIQNINKTNLLNSFYAKKIRNSSNYLSCFHTLNAGGAQPHFQGQPIAKGCTWIWGNPEVSSSLLGYGENFKIFLLLLGYEWGTITGHEKGHRKGIWEKGGT